MKYATDEQIKADAGKITDSSTSERLSNALGKATPECSSKMPEAPQLKRWIRKFQKPKSASDSNRIRF